MADTKGAMDEALQAADAARTEAEAATAARAEAEAVEAEAARAEANLGPVPKKRRES